MREYDEATLKKLQNIELMILKDIVALCEDNNLSYFGFAGTAIGAVRHGGFIPWDDDIDLGMPRNDFTKLIHLIEEQYPDKYTVMDAQHDSNCPLMATRIMLKGTVFRDWTLKDIKCELGIFVDIFPFDKVSDNLRERKKQSRRVYIYNKLLILRSIPFPVLVGMSGVKAKIIHVICACIFGILYMLHISKPWLTRKCIDACIQYNECEVTEYINFMCGTTFNTWLYKTDDVFPLQKIKFEDMELNFPNNLNEVLSHTYGDYMKLPPESKRKNHFPKELDFGGW